MVSDLIEVRGVGAAGVGEVQFDDVRIARRRHAK